MVKNSIPVRCWVDPDGATYNMPLLQNINVYEDWAKNNLNTDGEVGVFSLIKLGWLMIYWRLITCFEGNEERAINLACEEGVEGKWYTISVLMENGSKKVGSVRAGSPKKEPTWWVEK